ncbi:MAG: hypothetical protein ABJC63_06380 [Gemmatimonadales bacterium]
MTAPRNSQSSRTLQEIETTLAGTEVIAAAKDFFTRRNGIYAAFLDKEGPGYVTFRGQGGEEIVIGVASAGVVTRVSGSTYLFDQQIARFFSGLPTVASMATAAPVEEAPVGAGS